MSCPCLWVAMRYRDGAGHALVFAHGGQPRTSDGLLAVGTVYTPHDARLQDKLAYLQPTSFRKHALPISLGNMPRRAENQGKISPYPGSIEMTHSGDHNSRAMIPLRISFSSSWPSSGFHLPRTFLTSCSFPRWSDYWPSVPA